MSKSGVRRSQQGALSRPSALPSEHAASPYDRMAAIIVDYAIILSPFVLLFISPLQRIMREERLLQNYYQVETAKALAVIGIVLLVILFQTLFVWLWQATPGKMLLGLRIVSLSEDKKISLPHAFMRSTLWLGSCSFFGLPFLAIFSHAQRRPWHDRVAETQVVSVRPSRAVGRPQFAEFTFVRGVYWAVGAMLFFSFSYYISGMVQELTSKNRIIADLEANDELCVAVSDALVDWPDDSTDSARLDAALSLYGAGAVGISCLSSEVEKLFSLEDSFPLLDLARAFIYFDKGDVSESYIAKLCVDGPKSTECLFSRSILATEKNKMGATSLDDLLMEQGEGSEEYEIAEINSLLSLLEEPDTVVLLDIKGDNDEVRKEIRNELIRSNYIYPHVWSVREYVRQEKYELAEPHLIKIGNIRSLSSFAVNQQTRIYWAKGEDDKATGAESVAYSSMDALSAIQLSSYMCLERLWQDCTAIDSVSCSQFSSIVNEYDDVLSYSRASLALLKQTECKEGEGSRSYERLLARPLNDEVRRLVEVLIEPHTDGFVDFTTGYSQSKLLETEAHLRLIDRTKSVSLLKTMLADWQQSENSAHWKKVGRSLFRRFHSLNEPLDAFVVAEQLMSRASQSVERLLLEDIIRTADNLEKNAHTKKYLDIYLEKYPVVRNLQGADTRQPASGSTKDDLASNSFVRLIAKILARENLHKDGR